MSFLAALRFLTIFPSLWREVSYDELRRSVSYFPLVGGLIGLALAGLGWLLGLLLPRAVSDILLIIFLIVISGALHLDGVVDTCDGLAGKTVEDRLRIMRDSRAGGFGVIGAAAVLLAKYVSLTSIPQGLLMPVLMIMPVISRWIMVYAIFAFPYARPSGLGSVFKESTHWQSFAIASIIMLLVVTLFVMLTGAHFYPALLVAILGVFLAVTILARYLKGKFAGLTGDSYGAINEVAEVAFLVLVTMFARNQWLY